MPSLKLLTRADAMVEEGVAVLNQSKPRNWARRIRLSELNMSTTSNDILGQLYGDYWHGLIKTGFITKDARLILRSDHVYEFEEYPMGIYRAAECGFALGKEFMTWEALDIAWTKRILALRS